MKSFLTFTLAAGVAITTTSIAQAEGVGKGAMSANRPASTQTQTLMSAGAMGGLALDRIALNRELSRLSALLEPLSTQDDGEPADLPTQRKSSGLWSF